MVFLTEQNLQQILQSFLHVQLNEAEFLVTLIFEDFTKKRDFVVLFDVGFDAGNDRRRPVDDQRPEAVFLVEVGVHELLHGLDWQLGFATFDVVFDLLLVDVVDYVFELFERQDLLLVLLLRNVLDVDRERGLLLDLLS